MDFWELRDQHRYLFTEFQVGHCQGFVVKYDILSKWMEANILGQPVIRGRDKGYVDHRV